MVVSDHGPLWSQFPIKWAIFDGQGVWSAKFLVWNIVQVLEIKNTTEWPV